MEGSRPVDPFAPVPEDAEPTEGGARGLIAEGVRKALLAGVGAFFMTEEGARRLARDWKLPKDVIAFVGQQAQGAKEEILRVFAEEVRRFLESEAVRTEFWKALGDNAVEIRAEIRVRPGQGGAPRPTVAATARTRRRKKARR